MEHRIILIGHGVISNAYRSAFSKFENVRLAGVVGRNPNNVKAYADQHQIPVYGTNMEDVAVRANATAAVICTPNAFHFEGVIEASRLGLHILCEKPLHILPEKQNEMIQSCAEHGVKLAVSYQRRFIPHIQYIKQLLDSGSLGRITVMDITMKHFRPKSYYDSWHGTVDIDGGGPFIQQGSHMIDLACWLGAGYENVIDARMFQVYHDIETEDHGYAIIHYSNGAIGMIEASTACPGRSDEKIEISGTKGTITANYNEIVSFDVPGIECPEFSPDDTDLLFERLAADFIDAIEQDREPFVSGRSAKLATELVTDIYKIAGKPIRMY